MRRERFQMTKVRIRRHHCICQVHRNIFSISANLNLRRQIVQMHERAANRDDISNGALDVNFAEAFVDLLVARAAESGESLLVADFLSVAELLLELIFDAHQCEQRWCQVEVNRHFDDYAKR